MELNFPDNAYTIDVSCKGLTHLDVSRFTNLRELYCDDNKFRFSELILVRNAES